MAMLPGLQVELFGDATLTSETVAARVAWLRDVVRPRLERFLGYYRNLMTELEGALPCAAGTRFAVAPFRQFQEWGLPARLTGFRRAADGGASATGLIDVQRKEVVIENDIAWRIHTLVDFAAGKAPAIVSLARDPQTRARLTAVIAAIVECAGGLSFFQELVLQGAIYGSAWVHLRPTAELLMRLGKGATAGGGPQGSDPDQGSAFEVGAAAAGQGGAAVGRWLQMKIVETGRVCPLPRGGGMGCECVEAGETTPGYAAVLSDQVERGADASAALGFLERLRVWLVRGNGSAGHGRAASEQLSFDIFGPAMWQRYVDGVLVDAGSNPLGFVPFVRYENQRDAAAGTARGPAGSGVVDTGVGEVEPLIPLQDELNTRLSDRAYRVTMTAFRMFLGKGIDEFVKRPIGPGQMWQTDNTAATVEAFGGDAASPSESAHIEEVREALDKISGVPPVAAGLLRDKLGNLTSAVALRLTLVSLLARTDRRRAAITRTLSQVVRLVLEVLDRAGIVTSAPEDREIDVNWPSAVPEAATDQLAEAQTKLALGIPRSIVLGELGYGGLPEAESGTGGAGGAVSGERKVEAR
ncbi:MAG TPA: phage portal protein [Phycisphaerae bacterium]|nr:phage portal protein [Phycisphaerae bacterium]